MAATGWWMGPSTAYTSTGTGSWWDRRTINSTSAKIQHSWWEHGLGSLSSKLNLGGWFSAAPTTATSPPIWGPLMGSTTS